MAPSYLGPGAVHDARRRVPEDQLISNRSGSASDRRQYDFPVGSVFHALRDAVIVMSADWKLRDINPAGEQLFGYKKEEAVGREGSSRLGGLTPGAMDSGE